MHSSGRVALLAPDRHCASSASLAAVRAVPVHFVSHNIHFLLSNTCIWFCAFTLSVHTRSGAVATNLESRPDHQNSSVNLKLYYIYVKQQTPASVSATWFGTALSYIDWQ
jgi:hypothetical protein